MERYGNGLSSKPRIVAVNKIDQIDSDMTKFLEGLATVIPYKLYPVSALVKTGLDHCLEYLARTLLNEQCSKEEPHEKVSTIWTP